MKNAPSTARPGRAVPELSVPGTAANEIQFRQGTHRKVVLLRLTARKGTTGEAQGSHHRTPTKTTPGSIVPLSEHGLLTVHTKLAKPGGRKVSGSGHFFGKGRRPRPCRRCVEKLVLFQTSLTHGACAGWFCASKPHPAKKASRRCTRTVREMMETVRLPNPALWGAVQKPSSDGPVPRETAREKHRSEAAGHGVPHVGHYLFSPPGGVSREQTNVGLKNTGKHGSGHCPRAGSLPQGTGRRTPRFGFPSTRAKTSKNGPAESGHGPAAQQQAVGARPG